MLNKRMNLKIYQEEIKGYRLLLNLKIRKMDHVVDLYDKLTKQKILNYNKKNYIIFKLWVYITNNLNYNLDLYWQHLDFTL